MAGEGHDYPYGSIVDTVHFASQPTEACPQPATAQQIAEAWLAAGMAEVPKDEQVLEADLDRAEQRAADAQAEADAARELAEEASTANVALKAQVAELESIATGDAEKRAASLAAELATTQKALDERVEQLGKVREKVADELRPIIAAEIAAQSPASASDPALDAAIAELSRSTENLIAATAA